MAKARSTSKATGARKTKTGAAARRGPVNTKKKSAAPVRKARSRGAAGKAGGAVKAALDTVQETLGLRDKMEPTGTSDTQ